MGQPSVDYWFNRLLRTIDGLQKVVFVKISWRNIAITLKILTK